MSGLLIFLPEISMSPPLSRQDVHVWFCNLTWCGKDRTALAALLSSDEQTRAARFAFERDRHRFILSHGVLRAILSRYIDKEAAEIEFATGAYGKPTLNRLSGAAQEIQFSLSHSGEYALVAVARGRAVGVDVEACRPEVEAIKLAERFFAPSESRQVAQASDDTRQRLFYRYWTAKEAYLKGRGIGLSLGLDRFEILFDDQSPLAQVRETDTGALDTNWHVQSLSLDAYMAGALAVEGKAWQAQMFHVSESSLR